MTGGLIQLAAYGKEDLFLTHNPKITFFKMVYRRHTNFSTEIIPQKFDHVPDFGRRITAILGRSGDLIRKIYVVFELPRIDQFYDNNTLNPITKFMWVKRIGYALIKTVEIEIGDELVDKHYGDWLNIWHELTIPQNKNIDKLIGDIKFLTSPTNGKDSYNLYVPLQFWFNRITGLALPILSLQYNNVKINLEINNLDKCFNLAPTHYIKIDNNIVNFTDFEYIQQNIDGKTIIGQFIYFDIVNNYLYFKKISDDSFQSLTVTDSSLIETYYDQYYLLYNTRDDSVLDDPSYDPGSLVNDKYLITGLDSKFQVMPSINSIEKVYNVSDINLKFISLKNAFLLVEYIYLDDDERVKFTNSKLEYLIEQLQYNGEKIINSVNQSFRVGFTQPCKQLFWVTQLSTSLNTRNNYLFNYTDNLMLDNNHNFFGSNIILNQSLLFNSQERVTHRSSHYFNNIQSYQFFNTSSNNIINSYSFGLNPLKYQPSGTANFSKIDNILLNVNVNNNITFNNNARLRIYAIVYNIFRISYGISGVLFSSNIFNN